MKISGLPTYEPEYYCTRQQLAELMGVSVSTVDRLVRQGMPSVTWGKRTRRFRPSIAMQWARAQERKAASPPVEQQEIAGAVCKVCDGPLQLDEDGLLPHPDLCFDCFERERF